MLQTWIKIVAVSLLTLILGAPAPTKPVAEPDVYALLRIEDSEPQLLPAARHPAPPQSDPAAYRRTQVALLKSRPVLHSALKREEVKRLAILKELADPARWLERNVETTFQDKTGVLRVSFSEGRPQTRAVLINAIVAAYMDDAVYAGQRERQQRVQQLETAWNSAKAELKAKQDTIRRISQMQGATSSAFSRETDREEFGQLRKELLRVRLEKVGTQARFNHRKRVAGENDKSAIAKVEEEIAVFAAQEELLKKDISSLEKSLKHHANAEADKSERLSSLRKQIKAEEEFVDKLSVRLRREQVELLARPRISLMQKAEAPRKREK